MVANGLCDQKRGFGVRADARFKPVGIIEIVVPEGYDHTSCLNSFRKTHGEEFEHFHHEITDRNFNRPTVMLFSGFRFVVEVLQLQAKIPSDEGLDFLSSRCAVFLGAQGLVLAHEQSNDQLLIGRRCLSFDEKETLPIIDGYRRIPFMCSYSTGGDEFNLAHFDQGLVVGDCLLAFHALG
jgi:hypothetical protein